MKINPCAVYIVDCPRGGLQLTQADVDGLREDGFDVAHLVHQVAGCFRSPVIVQTQLQKTMGLPEVRVTDWSLIDLIERSKKKP